MPAPLRWTPEIFTGASSGHLLEKPQAQETVLVQLTLEWHGATQELLNFSILVPVVQEGFHLVLVIRLPAFRLLKLAVPLQLILSLPHKTVQSRRGKLTMISLVLPSPASGSLSSGANEFCSPVTRGLILHPLHKSQVGSYVSQPRYSVHFPSETYVPWVLQQSPVKEQWPG